jgi:hypothetical protein
MRLTPLLPQKTWLWHNNDSTGRDTYRRSNEGISDGPLVASFLKCATGPPPKGPSGSIRPVSFPERLALFAVTAHVATATSGFDLNRTLIPSDLSRRLVRAVVSQCECGRDRRQCLEDYGVRFIQVRLLIFFLLSTRPIHVLDTSPMAGNRPSGIMGLTLFTFMFNWTFNHYQ